MRDVDQSIRKKWRALELEVLEPAALPGQAFRAIKSAEANEDGFNLSFLRPLPITVAKFTAAAIEDMLCMAKSICRRAPVRKIIDPKSEFSLVREIASDKPLSAIEQISEAFLAPNLQNYADAFARDTKKIHHTLFGDDAPFRKSIIESGLFVKPRDQAVHIDYMAHTDVPKEKVQNGVIYVARVNALPIEVIDDKKLQAASKKMQWTIRDAQEVGGEAARQQLRQAGILRSIPLGDVVLMAAGVSGTLHCSSPVPPTGNYSTFFRTSAVLSPY